MTVGGWLLALVPVMFSYSGWNAAAYVAEEIREPSRRLPRALALGTAIVVIVYLAMNAFYLHVLPMAMLKALELRVIDAAAERLFAGAAAGALNGLSVLITAGTISAMVFAGPRVYYAMARDGLFLPAAARVHPRWRTPVVSIAAQGVWSAILVLSGTFSQLASYTGFAIVLFAGIAVAGLFVLRWREPDAAAPVPRLGLSAGAGAVHRDERGDGRQRGLARPRSVRRRTRRHRLRRADLLSCSAVARRRPDRAEGHGSAVSTAAAVIATAPAFGYSAGVLLYGH